MKVINFSSRPDYAFSDDERGNTVLIWQEKDPDVDTDECFRCREMLESGEKLEYFIYGYKMPTTPEEYEEIMESIRSGDSYALEYC